MALYLLLKTGPSQGSSVLIQDGLIIGRRGTGELRLKDEKVSSKHAKIESGELSGFILTDLDSKNGIWSHGKQVKQLNLIPGTQFEVGTTVFEVTESQEAPSPQSSPRKSGKRWNEYLASFLRQNLFNFSNETKELTPFRPALVMDFLRGPQTETRWILGYGPRKVGRLSPDLPIFEEQASEICFEIFSTSDGLSIRPVGSEVLLNGKPLSTEVLKVGDRIQIYGTEIEVDFTE